VVVTVTAVEVVTVTAVVAVIAVAVVVVTVTAVVAAASVVVVTATAVAAVEIARKKPLATSKSYRSTRHSMPSSLIVTRTKDSPERSRRSQTCLS